MTRKQIIVCIVLSALLLTGIHNASRALPPCPPGYTGELVGVVCDQRTSPISPLEQPRRQIFLPIVGR